MIECSIATSPEVTMPLPKGNIMSPYYHVTDCHYIYANQLPCFLVLCFRYFFSTALTASTCWPPGMQMHTSNSRSQSESVAEIET
jgi:hypothetical protein